MVNENKGKNVRKNENNENNERKNVNVYILSYDGVVTGRPSVASYAYTMVPCSHRLGGPLTQLPTALPPTIFCSQPASRHDFFWFKN